MKLINKYIKQLFKNVIGLWVLMFILPTIAFANQQQYQLGQ